MFLRRCGSQARTPPPTCIRRATGCTCPPLSLLLSRQSRGQHAQPIHSILSRQLSHLRPFPFPLLLWLPCVVLLAALLCCQPSCFSLAAAARPPRCHSPIDLSC